MIKGMERIEMMMNKAIGCGSLKPTPHTRMKRINLNYFCIFAFMFTQEQIKDINERHSALRGFL